MAHRTLALTAAMWPPSAFGHTRYAAVVSGSASIPMAFGPYSNMSHSAYSFTAAMGEAMN